MAYEAGTAYLSVIPSMRGNARTIADEMAGPMRGAGRQSGQAFAGGMTDGESKRGFVASGRQMAGAFAAVFAAVGAAEIGRSVMDYMSTAVQSATDLNETINRSNIIFGENAAQIEDWAAGAARSMGLSKAAALDSATGFANMFSQLGFGAQETANLSTSVVQLSADLGSFNNLPTEDVANRISAAFRGEYDSLQLLIPNINAARVQQEALAMTGKTAASSLTAQEKATATLAIVQRDGAAAAGDFANTSDSLANSSKILEAELANVQAEIGQALLPVVTDLMRTFLDVGVPALKDLATWFTQNEEAIRTLVVQFVSGSLAILQGFLALIRMQYQWYDAFVTVADNVLRFWFTVADGILAGAEKAFGWIPGVGDRLAETRRAFDQTRSSTESNLGRMRAAADNATSGIRAGERAVGDLRAAVQKIDGLTSTVRVRVDLPRYSESDIPGTSAWYAARGIPVPQARAHGGPIVAGRPYLVGERGPELIVPNTSGTVIPNDQLGTAGGFPSSVTLLDADGSILARTKVIVADKARAQRLAGVR